MIGYSLRLAGVVALLAFSLPLTGNAAPRQQLRGGHDPAAVKRLVPTGSLPGKQRLNLAIGLPLRNQQELDALLQQLYDPASPNYRHYLTPEEFTQRFGPTEADYQTVLQFASTNGFTVRATYPHRALVSVSATALEIERAFQVELRTYRHPAQAREFYAPDVEPSVEIGVPMLTVSGLNNYEQACGSHKLPANPSSGTANGTGPFGMYQGYDFRNAYVPGVTLNGSGQYVGLVEMDGYFTNDITAYETQTGLPHVPLIVVPLSGSSGYPDNNTSYIGEVSLDIEMVISMAPGLAGLYVFEGNNFDEVLGSMVTNTAIKQFSSSFFGYGFDSTGHGLLQMMAAQGQTFFQASGDGDAYTSPIVRPADDPYVTSTGGTALTMDATGSNYVLEVVWNSGFQNPSWPLNGEVPGGGYWGSGGGSSSTYSIPAWQPSVSMTAVGGSATKRNIPDVSMTGANVWVNYFHGLSGGFNGTSIAAPLWAGFTALVNQHAVASGQPPVGFLNPALYTIGKSSKYTTAFHDITTGNNYWTDSATNYAAATGYDLCTGWGTPNGADLISLLIPGAPPVPSAPRITSQPQSQTVTAGARLSFSVLASGTPPLDYQWLFNGQPISAATGATYSIARVLSSQAGTYTVGITNAYGSVTSAPATLVVSSATAFGILGAPFGPYQIPATNNPTWYSVSGLPPGLKYDPVSGLVYGIPTQTGTFWVIMVAGNNLGSMWTATIGFTIADGAITSATNAVGVLGAPFGYQITADNDPISYSASGPPSGLYLDPGSGLILGTPSQTGTFWVTVGAKNQYGSAAALVRFTIVNGAITSPTNVLGVIGTPLSYPITANNNPSSYSASGPPPGLYFDLLAGVISGIPTQIGTFWVTVQAKNMFGSASALVEFTIAGIPSASSLVSSLNPANYGQAVIFTATVTGGRPTPTGAVTFYDGASVIGAAAVNSSGVATLASSRLSVAGSPHAITAAYNGDSLYAPSTSTAISQVIYPALLTETAIIAPKVYDGTTNAPVAAVHLAGVISGDEPYVRAGSTNAFYADNKNVGTGKPVRVTITLGGSLAGNYTNGPFSSSGAVTARPITVTAVTDTKNYDGNTNSDSVATLTAGSLASGDLATWTQTFDSPNAGARTLTPVGTVTDGHSGANYNVTWATAPGYINPVCSTMNRLLWISNNANSTFTIGLQGTFQAQYYVMASTNAAALMSAWVPLAGSTNIITNASGLWNLTMPASGTQRYYRSVANQVCP